ncbi:hypothetical protein TNCV_1837031 [Trichonephila clavipes]|nr:hypothetical protein TNCV_1837031 [Trichonephila clavipes]
MLLKVYYKAIGQAIAGQWVGLQERCFPRIWMFERDDEMLRERCFLEDGVQRREKFLIGSSEMRIMSRNGCPGCGLVTIEDLAHSLESGISFLRQHRIGRYQSPTVILTLSFLHRAIHLKSDYANLY